MSPKNSLRKFIKLCLTEDYFAKSMNSQPDGGGREQLADLTNRGADDDDVIYHFYDQEFDQEECEGPVPPKSEPVRIYADPYVNDWGFLNTRGTSR